MTDKRNAVRDRRSFVKAAGVAGLVGLAGCTGGGSGDGGSGKNNAGSGGSDGESGKKNSGGSKDLVVTTSSSSTSVYAATQGISAVVNENTQDVRLDVRPSEGFAANMGVLNRDEADVAALAGNLAYDVINKNPPFENVSFELTQLLHIHNTDWFLASANQDWTSWDDITAQSKVSPAPNGTSVRSMLSYAMEDVLGINSTPISIGFGDQGGALDSGRLDAGIGAITNPNSNATEPSWVQQMKSVTDLRALDIPDEMVKKLEEDPKMTISQVEMDEKFDGYAYAPKTADLLSLVTYLVAPASLSEDAVYTMLSTMWENNESLGGYHSLLKNHTDAEWWVSDAFTDVPFHPGAAKFYKEQGVWKDDFTTP